VHVFVSTRLPCTSYGLHTRNDVHRDVSNGHDDDDDDDCDPDRNDANERRHITRTH
jgi:hypothetical protein